MIAFYYCSRDEDGNFLFWSNTQGWVGSMLDANSFCADDGKDAWAIRPVDTTFLIEEERMRVGESTEALCFSTPGKPLTEIFAQNGCVFYGSSRAVFTIAGYSSQKDAEEAARGVAATILKDKNPYQKARFFSHLKFLLLFESLR